MIAMPFSRRLEKFFERQQSRSLKLLLAINQIKLEIGAATTTTLDSKDTTLFAQDYCKSQSIAKIARKRTRVRYVLVGPFKD